jgi:hypothetical protein
MTVTRSDGVSAEVLRQQLMNANTRLEVVSAQCAALGAKTIKSDVADLDILERVALALRQAAEACRAVQSVPFDPAGHHTPHPNDRAMPGSATRRARYQRDRLERHLEDALDSWEQAKENDFATPSRAKVPKVRCRRRDCSKYDRRVPAWDVNGKGNEFCSGCGERLPAPEEAA